MHETAGGGSHIAYRQDGSPEETPVDIPGLLVKMARAVGNGKISVSREAVDGQPPADPAEEPATTRPPVAATQ